jgi:hypothetical protein
MAKIEWMPAPDVYAGRQLESTYNAENILIEIWSYYENPDRLYYFNITEHIPYKGRTIVARYSLDNIQYNGTFYSLETCQSFIEKLLDDCEEGQDNGSS